MMDKDTIDTKFKEYHEKLLIHIIKKYNILKD